MELGGVEPCVPMRRYKAGIPWTAFICPPRDNVLRTFAIKAIGRPPLGGLPKVTPAFTHAHTRVPRSNAVCSVRRLRTCTEHTQHCICVFDTLHHIVCFCFSFRHQMSSWATWTTYRTRVDMDSSTSKAPKFSSTLGMSGLCS